MVFHQLKAEDVEYFCNLDNVVELVLAGIASLNSNSCLFGGRENNSFKIKAKKMNQRIKKIVEILKKECV